MKQILAFFVVALLATATAFAATPTGVVGNAVVRPLPLANGELFCGSFGGENTSDMFIVTLQGTVSRAYLVTPQNDPETAAGFKLVTDSTKIGDPLCINVKNGNPPTVAGQVGTINGQSYLTTLSSSGAPLAIVLTNDTSVLQIGSSLPGKIVVTSFKNQPVASDGPVVLVNEDQGDGLLYRYDGSTWIPVPKPTGKWATYYVVGTGAQRVVYAVNGIDTVAVFSGGATTVLFDANHPPVAGNPISCCLTMTISPVDGTGLVIWGTGQGNSYLVASFVPGQPATLVAQDGNPPDTSITPPAIPTAMWAVNSAGSAVMLVGSATTTDLSVAESQGTGQMSYLWNKGLNPIQSQGMVFNNNGVQLLHAGWPEKFLTQQFEGFLPGGRINSEYQGIWYVATTTGQQVVLSGYIPLVYGVFENASGLITLQTNLPQDPNVIVLIQIYGAGYDMAASLDNNGAVSFQTPSNMSLGEHPFTVQACTCSSIKNTASSAWIDHDFGTATSPTVSSFTAAPTGITAGQSTNLNWSVTNAATVSIDQSIWPVAATGTIAVSPTATTTYTLTACNPGGCTTASVTVTVTQPVPVINAGGVVNAATFDARFSPASIITLFGQNLAGGTASALFQQGAFVSAWTDQTGQAIQVLVGGQPCPLIYIAPTQINCQLSWTIPVGSPVPVQALKGGLGSDMVNITLTATAPAPFMYQGMAIITALNWQLVTARNPAVQGGNYTLWLQGLGPTTNNPADGVPFSDPPLPKAQAEVELTIAGNSANVLYAGGAPGEVINQLNFVLPALPPGNGDAGPVTVTATLTVGGQTFTLSIPVQ